MKPVQNCRKCGEIKPLAEFHRDKTRSNGRKYVCKTCRNLDKEEKLARSTQSVPNLIVEMEKYLKKAKNNWDINPKDFESQRMRKSADIYCPSCTMHKFPAEFYASITLEAADRSYCRTYCKNCERLRRKYKLGPWSEGGVKDAGIPGREWSHYRPDFDKQRELVKQWKERRNAQVRKD